MSEAYLNFNKNSMLNETTIDQIVLNYWEVSKKDDILFISSLQCEVLKKYQEDENRVFKSLHISEARKLLLKKGENPYKIIFIIIFIDTHWTLMVCTEFYSSYYNSLPSFRKGRSEASNLHKILKTYNLVNEKFVLNEIHFPVEAQQNSFFECGYFVLLYIKIFLYNKYMDNTYYMLNDPDIKFIEQYKEEKFYLRGHIFFESILKYLKCTKKDFIIENQKEKKRKLELGQKDV